MLEELKNKKVLILGFGREGVDTFLFLRKLFPNKVLGIADIKKIKNLIIKSKIKNLIIKDKKIRWHLGKNYLKALKSYDVIIKSPGIPPRIITPFIIKKQKVTSQTEIFFENCPGKIVGVTGTKGKGTTASLIYTILKKGGFKVHLIGNIGKPVLNFLFSANPQKIYVYELSSHQLYNLRKSPHIAVFLNISPAHLDYFRNFNEYIKAKANISRFQTKDDFLIYNSKDKIVKEIAEKSQAKKIPLPVKYGFKNKIKNEKLLRGKFNLLNVAAAIMVAKIFRVSKENIFKAIKKFKTLPHRLELVGTYKMIKFYDDSAATVPEATINALLSLGKNVQTLILGGHESNICFRNLAKQILKSKIKNLILFPTNGKKIQEEIFKNNGKKRLFQYFFVDNMKDAVKLAYQHTKEGKSCLLSCASASFGIFRNYKERGNLFKKYVKKFAYEKNV